MKTFEIHCLGCSDLFFSAPVPDEKKSDETHEQFDARTWRSKVNNVDGRCFIQPFAIKNGLESAAKRLSMKVPGQGQATYSKLFRQGIMLADKCWLSNEGSPLLLDSVNPLKLFVPSGGKRGEGSRVWRIFPAAKKWEFDARIYVLDGKIDKERLEKHITEMGMFIGVGAMRVENGGINGRFKLISISEVSESHDRT